MRSQSQGVVFFLFHVDPVGDEVGVKDVTAEEERMIGLERFDRAEQVRFAKTSSISFRFFGVGNPS